VSRTSEYPRPSNDDAPPQIRDGVTIYSVIDINILSFRLVGTRFYRYRAIDRSGALVDVIFSEHRDMAAAKAFFGSAKMVTGFVPDQVTTDGQDSYPKAVRTILAADVQYRDTQ
jgi:transposase-like protein